MLTVPSGAPEINSGLLNLPSEGSAIMRRFRLPCPALFCFVTTLTTIVVAAAAHAEKPSRLMPFLCRDAVVRESTERTALVGETVVPNPVIVRGTLPPGPRQAVEQQHIARAVSTMRRYLEKVTGVRCEVVNAADAAQARGPRIFIGEGDDPTKVFPELATADAHAFLIATKAGPHGTDLHIASASGIGTAYGVWFFLMNYADVRIVLPGEIGETYPKLDRLEIPKELYVLNPAPDFLLRVWSGIGGFDPTAWLADSGGTQRFEYHHNMWRIYDIARFAQTRPEFYPMRSGNRSIPAAGSKGSWQPTFGDPVVAQRAIEYADELFTSRPDMMSVSLSVNDGGGYSEPDIRGGKLLPDGSVTISPIYYEYVNIVARAVKERWPEKYVAFFPYGFVKTPPDFKLEDNVMLFLFSSRGNPKQVYDEWQGKVKHLGVYLWLYGVWHVIPNHWPHGMQDCLRWLRERGCRAFKGEAYAAWAQDGTKMWVLNNLLWNADADVDALLKDYYKHCYGKEAAPAMARYFAQAEKIYERRRTPDEYRFTITSHPGEQQFQDTTPEDFEIMAKALDEASRAVRGDANRRRVDMTTRCFRWGRYYGEQYHALERLRTAKVETEEQVQPLLEAATRFSTISKDRDAYFDTFIKPMPQYCIFSRTPDEVDRTSLDLRFRWGDLDESMDAGFGAITAFKRRNQSAAQVAEFWKGISEEYPLLKPFAETQRLNLLHRGTPLENLIRNPSFEEPPVPASTAKTTWVANNWTVVQIHMVNATVSLDKNTKHSGNASVTVKGITRHSGASQGVRLKNGSRYRLSCWYRTSKETKNVLQFIYCPPFRIDNYLPLAEEWTKAERIFTLNMPEKGEEVGVTFRLVLGGSSDKSQVWFDDVRLEMLAPEGLEEGERKSENAP